MNSVNLIGRITRDVEMRYSQTGRGILTNTIAVQRNYKNVNGEYDSDFIDFIAFGKTAEFIANYIVKGNQIGITGRIQTRNYEGKDGKRVYVTEVVADSVVPLTPKKQTTNQFGNPVGTRQVEEQDPYSQFGTSFKAEELDDDLDLPF